jgi:hypothetical protein
LKDVGFVARIHLPIYEGRSDMHQNSVVLFLATWLVTPLKVAKKEERKTVAEPFWTRW